jgi:hypothetical protein
MAIDIQGLESRAQEIMKMSTDIPTMKKELQSIIRKAIAEARKNVVMDAKGVLSNDPRQAYKAVRSSVYKQILGGQINILSSKKRGAPTHYQKPRTLKEGQRGGNRRRRSERTMQVESYHGTDRGFILRFINAGTDERETRYGVRGSLRTRDWFGRSTAFQLDAAASRVASEIEKLLASEFKLQ